MARERITTESKVLADTPYSFGTRFEGTPGTNPEELLGAAHAGCFTMALSLQLGEAGITPERIETKATITFEKLETGFTITRSHLDVTVQRARRGSRQVRRRRRERQGRLPAQQGAESRDLDGRAARGLMPELTPVSPRDPGARPRRGARLLRRVARLPGGPQRRGLGGLRFLRPPARLPRGRRDSAPSAPAHNPVDGHDVPVPHFGMVLEMPDWEALAAQLRRAGVAFVIEPYDAVPRPGGRAGDDVPDRPERQCARIQGVSRHRGTVVREIEVTRGIFMRFMQDRRSRPAPACWPPGPRLRPAADRRRDRGARRQVRGRERRAAPGHAPESRALEPRDTHRASWSRST